mmetsp:Transcript_85570/g.164752  ORF Transcript_85570/g.164752 Transcript_85570/m.164752 type:complete len:220 (-) Transcript_85570:55-714(-)
MALLSSPISSVNFAIEACNSSISACRVSTASVFSFRVCSFVESSVSHHPLCSASSFASSIKRTNRSLIIFFTFAKGSSATRTARAERIRLFNWRPCSLKNSATRLWTAVCSPDLNWPSDMPFFWTKVGKYLSAFPETALLDRISMAFAIASSSSVRNCCLASKSEAFCEQVAFKSSRYFWSASRVVVVSCKSPSASAFDCNFLALVSAFSVLSAFACSV